MKQCNICFQVEKTLNLSNKGNKSLQKHNLQFCQFQLILIAGKNVKLINTHIH